MREERRQAEKDYFKSLVENGEFIKGASGHSAEEC